jgi:hypothetical protein
MESPSDIVDPEKRIMTRPGVPLTHDVRFHRLVRLLREIPVERRDALLKTLKENQLSTLLRSRQDDPHGSKRKTKH